MHLPLILLLAFNHLIATNAFLTHESIRNLTATTDDCRDRITEVDAGRESVVQILGGGQVVLLNGHGDGEREEVEVVSL
jgi:hypothetical protein